MNGIRIEAWTAEGVEIRNQAGARRDLDLQIFFACDALVDTPADAAAFAERAVQPGGVGFANALAGNADPHLNAALEEERDPGVKHGALVCPRQTLVVRRHRGCIGRGRNRVH